MQRAVELQNYLNLLIHHPITQQSVVLRLFLVLQDDLGSVWPEVSSNAFTRLANASVGAAALLTGMGADGAAGLLKLRQRGWFTIAQDESSSAVFGMPRAAIQLGAASRIVSLSDIGSTLAQNLFRS